MTLTPEEIEADSEARTTAVGLFGYACEFFAVAVAANDSLGHQHRRAGIALTPVNFAIGQAIELGLKSYLREKGASLKQMRAWGHDLHLLSVEARKQGWSIDWDPTDETLLALLNQQYKSREFQYIKTGSKTFPQFDPLAKTTAKILKVIAEHVPSAETFFLDERIGRAVIDLEAKKNV